MRNEHIVCCPKKYAIKARAHLTSLIGCVLHLLQCIATVIKLFDLFFTDLPLSPSPLPTPIADTSLGGHATGRNSLRCRWGRGLLSATELQHYFARRLQFGRFSTVSGRGETIDLIDLT